MKAYLIIGFCISVTFLASCSREEVVLDSPGFMEIPQGFDNIEYPPDNLFTIEKWELGKKLFYDSVMSLDSSLSCASCHKPELAFSDDVPFSVGVEERSGTRNTPSLVNVAYHPYLTREGGVPTLEMQILVPIQEHNEFDFNIVLLADRLNNDSTYVKMSKLAFGRIPDAFVVTRALACFERSLISGYSRFDQYTEYLIDGSMSADEIDGMQLFYSERTQCSTCHSGFNFTNYKFENNGLYTEYLDEGRFRLTGKEHDKAKFKIPGLRNIELTAPYMHDGSMNSLEEVVEHYNSGGYDHFNKSSLIKPLGLTEKEKSNLVAFLKTLTDNSFVDNPIFK